MAQVILSNIVKKNKRKDIIVGSAGTDAWGGQPMMDGARLALTQCGEKLPKTPHKSTRFTIEMQKSFDRIIDVRGYLDPFGHRLEVYIELCKQLQTACQKLYDEICNNKQPT
jgi:protein-tyrosine-phosphatase